MRYSFLTVRFSSCVIPCSVFVTPAFCTYSLRVINFALYYHAMEQQQQQDFQPPPPATSTTAVAPTMSMTEQELNVVALGLAYHDIGFWTPNSGSLVYLEPSVAVMEQEIHVASSADGGRKKNKTLHAWMTAASLPAFTSSDLATAREIILRHRKITTWTQQANEQDETTVITVDATLVNAVRRADWTDATMGMVRYYGMSSVHLETVYNAIPALGFHGMLLSMCRRLSPHSRLSQLAVLQNLQW
jgi:hypothetical protein